MRHDLAFIIACVVSFRSLFVRKATKSNDLAEERMRREALRQSALRRGWQARLGQLQDSILQTCKTLEGWSYSDAETHSLPHIPSGLMTVDFNDDRKWAKYTPSTTATSHERTISAPSPVEAPEHARGLGE
ncbi:hypothetical protein RRF57_007725 [Xylaria bambusicola]|uniref:Uncharacterized protein n=1 Tax=Xylaria bambusicola TaxID=326684 RepID=A0AAN7USI1_9PEZI